MTVSYRDQLACAIRESGMRKRVYPKWVAQGKMTPVKAAQEQAAMDAIVDTLRPLAEAGPNSAAAMQDTIDRLTAEVAGLKADSIAGVWAQAKENHRLHSATNDQEGDIRFLTLGLAGEAGEVANFVKKRWRDGDAHTAAIQMEVADVCAYAFMLADVMGMTPATLIQTIADKQRVFLAKMAARAALAAQEPTA